MASAARGRAGLLLVGTMFALPFAAGPARADCTQLGLIVTCAPPGDNGFVAPFGIDGLTVTVTPGTTVRDDGTVGIQINGASTVINNGDIVGGNGVAGIGSMAGDNNNVTNNGSIAIGNFGFGVYVNDGGSVVNNGTITTGDLSPAIFGFGGVSVTNWGTISVGTFQSSGIEVDNNSTVVNNGFITGLATSPGIVGRTGNTITNNGTIVTANDFSGNGAGILVNNNNVVVNNGTILAGDANGTAFAGGIGVAAATGNTITNNGTIRTGAYGISFAPPDGYFANGNTIVNNGVADGLILLFSDGASGSGNNFTNNGIIGIGNTGTPYTSHFVDGTFTQSSTGTLALRFSSNTASAGFDHLVVTTNSATDKISLAGNLTAVIQGSGFQNTQTYFSAINLCNCFAGTIEGTFDSVTTTSPFFTATAAYGANDVDITLTRVAFGAVPDLTPNQQSVGNGLEQGFSPGLTGDAATFYANVLSSTSPSVLDQLSGEGTAAAQGASFTAANLFNFTMLQQGLWWLNAGNTTSAGDALGFADTARPGHDAFAAVQPKLPQPGRWHAWALGFGADRTVSAELSLGAAEQTQRTAGGAIGADYRAGGDLLVGFAVGGSTSHFSVDSRSTSGQVDGAHAGLYLFKSFGPMYLAATLNYARLSNTTERTIAGAGPTETATGDFDADQLSGRIELGRSYRFADTNVRPFVALAPAILWQRAYTEASTVVGGGGGMLGLSYDANTVTSLPASIGVQIDGNYALPGGQFLSPMLRLSWVHEFETERGVQASFTSVPAAGFTVQGAPAGRDALRVDGGASLTLGHDVALFANLMGEFADGGTLYAATAGARITW